jgi:hypothetical protein
MLDTLLLTFSISVYLLNKLTKFSILKNSQVLNNISKSYLSSVSPGKYHYVRLEFCKYTSGINIQFQAGNMTSPYSFGQSSCAVTSARKDPPLEVKAGDAVVVQIDYNLNGTIWVNNYGDGGGESCSDTVPSYCFQLPQFVPNAVVNE